MRALETAKLMAILLATASQDVLAEIPRIIPEGYKQKPINTGRRVEKDKTALAKAQSKRDRRAAKRIKGSS